MNLKTSKGFTIVELLIVIVVIAILAAISIVAYTGIQSRARASAAQSLASSIAKKAEIYNLDDSTTSYPTTLAALTGATSDKSYAVNAADVTFTTATLSATTTNPQKTVNFQVCGHSGTTTAPTSLAGIGTNVTGNRVAYWNGSAVAYATAGNWNTNVGTYPVACFNTAS